MSKQMRRAYDQASQNSLAGEPKTFGHTRAARPQAFEVSIEAALHWAFGVELAQLDFDDLAPEGARRGIDTIAVLMERGSLGCKVDGGGRSRAASDAEIIADALTQLPIGCGGAGMAVQIVHHARAGTRPDWMPGAAPRLVPRAWAHGNQHGRDAATELVRFEPVVERGRIIKHEVRCCPVTWDPSAATIASARRHYLQWWSALLHLRAGLVSQGRMELVRLTKVMPPLKPWAQQAC